MKVLSDRVSTSARLLTVHIDEEKTLREDGTEVPDPDYVRSWQFGLDLSDEEVLEEAKRYAEAELDALWNETQEEGGLAGESL